VPAQNASRIRTPYASGRTANQGLKKIPPLADLGAAKIVADKTKKQTADPRFRLLTNQDSGDAIWPRADDDMTWST